MKSAKKRMSLLLSALLLFTSVFSLDRIEAQAATVGSYATYNTTTKVANGMIDNVEGVVQGNNSTDFVSLSPIPTIYIDEEMINTPERRRAAIRTLYYKEKENYGNGSKYDGFRIGALKTSDEEFMSGATTVDDFYLIYDQRKAPDAFKIKRDQDNLFEGKIVSYKFLNAAETEGGKKAHVVFTYSNINIVLQSSSLARLSDDNYAKLESFCILGGNLLQVAGTMRTGTGSATYSQVSDNMRYGISFEINVKVVDDEDNIIPGDFYYRMVDVDTTRTQDGFKALYNSDKNNNMNFSEHAQLISGAKPYTNSSARFSVFIFQAGLMTSIMM